jgi:hypothetical protein
LSFYKEPTSAIMALICSWEQIHFGLITSFSAVLGIEPRTLHILSKCSTSGTMPLACNNLLKIPLFKTLLHLRLSLQHINFGECIKTIAPLFVHF